MSETLPPRRSLDPQLETGMLSGPKRSVMTYAIGGREYPVRGSSRCVTCHSPYREDVERGLMGHLSRRSVLESLPADHGLTSAMLRQHEKNHMPLRETAERLLLERMAQNRGVDIEQAAGSLLDARSFLTVLLQRVYEGIVDGYLRPDVKDGIAASKALAELDLFLGDAVEQSSMVEQATSWARTMREVIADYAPEVSVPIMQEVRRRLEGDASMRGLLPSSSEAIEVSSREVSLEDLSVIVTGASDGVYVGDVATATIFVVDRVFESVIVTDATTAIVTRVDDVEHVDPGGEE